MVLGPTGLRDPVSELLTGAEEEVYVLLGDDQLLGSHWGLGNRRS